MKVIEGKFGKKPEEGGPVRGEHLREAMETMGYFDLPNGVFAVIYSNDEEFTFFCSSPDVRDAVFLLNKANHVLMEEGGSPYADREDT